MKDYRETMKDLSFTQEQKVAMVERLLAEQPQAVTRRPGKRLFIAVAALLALMITACGAGWFPSLTQAIAQIIAPTPSQAQTQTIHDHFSPIGISDTDNGVTVTVEGVVGDTNSISVLYSITRDNGEPLIPPSEETAQVSDGDHLLFFETNTSHELTESLASASGTGNVEVLDFHVSAPTLYFLTTWTYFNTEVHRGGQVEVTFENLYAEKVSVTEIGRLTSHKIPLVQGTWNLAFDLDYEPAALTLPTDQTFHYKELTGAITDLRISPLSFHLEYDYTMDMEALAARYDPATAYPPGASLEDWARIELMGDSAMYLSLNFTDGSSTPLFLDGDISQPGHAIVSGTFETIYPLGTIESITIGDLTIPVEAP